MTATTPTVLTVSGTPIDFLPLVTPYSAPTSCSSYIYRQLDSTYLAFDPYYGSYIDTAAATCQPSQVISWWNQASGVVTTTALGTTFNCPALYSTVTTTTASGFQHVYCCPSGYNMYSLFPETAGAFPSQCTSHATPGGELSFMSLMFNTQGAWTSTKTTSTSPSSTITVFGIPVNGYNKLASTATATSSDSGSSSSTAGVSTTAAESTATTASGTPSSTASSGGEGGLSTGASIGIGVGVGIGGLLAVLGAIAVFWRMCRRRRQAAGGLALAGDKQQPGWYYGGPPPSHAGDLYAQGAAAATPMSEMPTHDTAKYGAYNTPVYEAPSQYQMPELDSTGHAQEFNRR